MREARLMVARHFAALREEAAGLGVGIDLVGRLLLDEILAAWRTERSRADIESELDFARANLDPDQEYTFMRP